MKKRETKSPISEKPLRYPAQSLDEKIDKIFDEKLIHYIFTPSVFILIALVSWINYFTKTTLNPIIMTLLAIVAIIWYSFKMIKLRKELKALKQGRDGEREVGMNVEPLRELGLKVYHDILGESFNLDHVLVGEKGIFVIETKTYSKPKKGPCNIIFDGINLSYNGTYKSNKPIIQAKAGAYWLSNYLRKSTGKSFNVHPIVVFPGWYTKTTNPKNNIWILNPKGLGKVISNLPDMLSREDVALISDRIETHIKNTNYT